MPMVREWSANICDQGSKMLVGSQFDGTFRMHLEAKT